MKDFESVGFFARLNQLEEQVAERKEGTSRKVRVKAHFWTVASCFVEGVFDPTMERVLRLKKFYLEHEVCQLPQETHMCCFQSVEGDFCGAELPMYQDMCLEHYKH